MVEQCVDVRIAVLQAEDVKITRRLVTSRRVWRSGGDSNPRNAFDVYTLSRRASSTTRAPLLGESRISA